MNIQEEGVAIGIDVQEKVLRRSSIEPGPGGCCYPCWAAPVSAAVGAAQAQAPCEDRAPWVVALAQTTVFVRALA